MTKARILSPTVSLVDAMAAELVAGHGDYSQTLVLFPGRRPGYILRSLIAERERRSFIPPVILSMDEFVDTIVKLHPNDPVRDIESLDATAVLFDVHRALPEPFGGKHFASLDAFLPLGRRLFNELEELVLALSDPPTVRKKIGGVSFGGVHTLSTVFEKFYQEVDVRGLRTPAMKYAAAAGALVPNDVQQYRRVLVGGFFAVTKAEQNIFKRISELESVRFFFQQGPHLYAQLELLGLEYEEDENALTPVEPSVQFCKSPDQHGEVFAVSAQLKDEAIPHDGQTVIVVPTASALNPLLQYVLADLKENEYNISLNAPVRSTPLFALLDLIVRNAESSLHGAVHAPAYTALLRHPYVKNTLFGKRADVSRVLVHAIERWCARNPATRFVDLADVEAQPEIIEATAETVSDAIEQIDPASIRDHLKSIHDVMIRPFEQIGSIGDLATKCSTAVHVVAEQSTARLHPLFQPFAQSILGSLESLQQSFIADSQLSSTRAYGQFLRSVLESTEIHFSGTPLHGLQVLGFLETRGLKFKRVFFLDANDDAVPGVGKAETLLIPQSLRADLGLETIHDAEKRAEYYWSTLLRGAEDVRLFYVDDGKRERSRFIERLVWDRQQAAGTVDETKLVGRTEYSLALDSHRPEPIAKSAEIVQRLRSMRYSPSALDTYLDCGRKFYFRHALNLREANEIADDVEQREIGVFVHAVLDELVRPSLNRTLSAEDLSPERVESAVERHWARLFGHTAFANHELIRERATSRINEFIARYQLPLIEQHSIVVRDSETALELPWQGFAFNVRVDRIEERNGETFILDFKTNHNDGSKRVRMDALDLADRLTWRKAFGSVQLPLYKVLYAALAGKASVDIHPAYVFLGGPTVDASVEEQLNSERSADNDLRTEEFLGTLLKEIVDPSAVFLPPEKLETACPRCPFTTMCKTQWVEGWSGRS